MRIGFRKQIGGFYVGGSTSTKGMGKGCLSIFLLPFYLVYYMVIWPFVALYKLLTKNKRKAKAMAAEMAPQYLRIMNDCSKLIIETKNPEIFFSRYELLLDTLSKLIEIEKIAPLKGSSASSEFVRLSSLKESATNEFIDRYAQNIKEKMIALSTPKAKSNKAEIFKTSLNCHFLKVIFCFPPLAIFLYRAPKYRLPFAAFCP